MHARFWFPGTEIQNNQLKQQSARVLVDGRIVWERRKNMDLLVMCKRSQRIVRYTATRATVRGNRLFLYWKGEFARLHF